MIEIALLIVVGVVTWMVAAEGVIGAAQTFLCTLLAALIAMNFFEPLAVQLKAFLPDEYCDFVALMGLFIILVFALRMGSEHLSPSYIQVLPALDTIGRWAFGAITGYLTMAFILTSLHTAPLPREFLGFKPERNNFFSLAPDRQWLGFMQYVSEKPLGWSFWEKIGSQNVSMPHAFDGRFQRVGDPSKLYSAKDAFGRETPQVIWPSFPIRYAMRRQRLSMSQSSAAPQQIVVPQTAPTPTPTGSGQPSNAGF